MTMTDIKTIGIIGAGQMGNGIAHVASQTGFDIILHDILPGALTQAMETIASNMGREVKREKISDAEQKAAMARISTTTELAALKDADMVIEAATENEKLKLEIYGQVAPHLKEGVLFASNTSPWTRRSTTSRLPSGCWKGCPNAGETGWAWRASAGVG